MNRGILEKAARETLPVTIGFGLLLLVVEVVISFVLPSLGSELYDFILKMEIVRTLLSALLGTAVTEDLGDALTQAIPWVHPVVLLIVFAHEITVCTRLPAGETDRGTIDLLLGLPVTRWQAYRGHSIVWLAGGAVLLGLGLLGHIIGAGLAGGSLPPLDRLAITLLEAYALYASIGALAWLVSAVWNRRGPAIGILIALVVGSFLINFLAEFWEPARRVSFLSLLTYYDPLSILQGEPWPVADIALLSVSGLVFWIAGGYVFSRRDIATT